MGFLIGMYGKLMAGKRVRSLQFRLTQVMSRIQRVTRQAADVERMMSSQQQNAQRMMRMQSIFFQNGITNEVQAKALGTLAGKNFEELSDAEKKKYQEAMYMANMQMQNQMQGVQMMQEQQQQRIQQEFENMRECQLEPLKDLEDSLQIEKGSLESQIQLAQADYESMKKMEQAGAKDYVPEYTGQG